VKTVPIGFKPVWLVIPVQRVGCCDCGAGQRIDIGIDEPRLWYIKAFERYVLALSMTMQDVADLLGVGWDIQSRRFSSVISLADFPRLHLENSNTSLLTRSVFEKATNI